MAFYPYLFFGGNCREAFARYQQIFGGELSIVTSADMPTEEQMPGAAAEAVMHASLVLPDGALLMGSDDPTTDAVTVSGIQVNHDAASVEDAIEAFEALAEGGQVNAPLEPTSFSPVFGMCVDRFGIPWMITVAQPT